MINANLGALLRLEGAHGIGGGLGVFREPYALAETVVRCAISLSGPLSRIRYTVGLLPLELPSGLVSLLRKLGKEVEESVRLAKKHVVRHKRLNRSDRTRLVCRGGSNDRTVR
jgi:hypothetical protein